MIMMKSSQPFAHNTRLSHVDRQNSHTNDARQLCYSWGFPPGEMLSAKLSVKYGCPQIICAAFSKSNGTKQATISRWKYLKNRRQFVGHSSWTNNRNDFAILFCSPTSRRSNFISDVPNKCIYWLLIFKRADAILNSPKFVNLFKIKIHF